MKAHESHACMPMQAMHACMQLTFTLLVVTTITRKGSTMKPIQICRNIVGYIYKHWGKNGIKSRKFINYL